MAEHGTLLPTDVSPADAAGRGNHTIEGFVAVANHTLRTAIVQTSADRGRVIRQTGGTGPGWYLALGTTGQWQLIGDADEATLESYADAAVTAHDGDGGAHAGTFDAAGSAATAQSNAEGYADSAVSTHATDPAAHVSQIMALVYFGW
jgi:hypothetical protein